MTAHFSLEGLNRPVLVIEPAYGDESILMAAFLRFDSNLISVSVERNEAGHIQRVVFLDEQSD